MPRICFSFIVLLMSLQGVIQAYRLSREVIPNHYSLKLHPDMDENTFKGEVTITICTMTNMKKITLHSSELNITEASVNKIPLKIVEEPDEKISVELEDGSWFQPGEHRLFFKYHGQFCKRYGLIKATYDNNYGNSGVLLVNEFEPIGARRAFPCFDEPVFKAQFNIRLVTPNETYYALSNMPEIAKYPTSNGVIYDFATSVKMSTYLISLAITDYSSYEEIVELSGKKIPLTVYTCNASAENNMVATSLVKVALKYYSNYTGIDYPLSKLGLIEYNKQAAMATETWGLVQFREGLLSKKIRSFDKWRRSLTIFHEMAHFWFGNLVTNDWWSDLWLQEGMASFMSIKLINDHYSTDVYAPIDLTRLIEAENNLHAYALVEQLRTPQKLEKRFDDIVYVKGESLIYALECIVTPARFQRTIRNYLKRFAFGTVTTNDFISLFEQDNPKLNIRSFLESYVFQTGLPIFNVEVKNGSYILRQTDVGGNSTKRWTVPVSYKEGKTSDLIWFDKDIDSVKINQSQESKWILFNVDPQRGIYLVNYTEDLWRNLFENLNELRETELTYLAENLNELYLKEIINCDLVLKFFDKLLVVSKTQVVQIFTSIIKILHNITCHASYEYNLLIEFFKEKGFDDSLLVFYNVACRQNETISEPVEQCRKWIRANLIRDEKAIISIVK